MLFCIASFCLVMVFFVKNLRPNYECTKELAKYVLKAEGSIQDSEDKYVAHFWKKESFINLNGRLAKFFGIRSYFKSKGIYVSSDMWIMGGYSQTSTDYEIEQISDFKAFLDENGINLLYVNEPVKYIDDAVFEKEFGLQSFSNRNLDLFLSRLTELGGTLCRLAGWNKDRWA